MRYAAEVNAAARPGDVVDGRYEVVALIGRGGMADVFRAKDLQAGEEVALKLLRGSLVGDAEARARFGHEAHTQSLVSHRNVAVMHGGGVEQPLSRVYLVMELLSGRSIAQVLHKEGRFEPLRAAVYAYQALAGLAATHAVGVLHRDLKPSNLMLEPSPGRFERVVLIDFGFAALDGATGLTRVGVVVGSPSYLAPERIEGASVDVRADIYSLGAILYEMLTGRPPFVGEAGHVLIAHCSEAPIPPSTLVPEIPEAMERIVLSSLAKAPDERPASAQAMADALEIAMQ